MLCLYFCRIVVLSGSCLAVYSPRWGRRNWFLCFLFFVFFCACAVRSSFFPLPLSVSGRHCSVRESILLSWAEFNSNVKSRPANRERERERGGERDRQRDRQRERERQRQSQRETETDRQTDRQRERNHAIAKQCMTDRQQNRK